MRLSNRNLQATNTEISNWDPKNMETYWIQCHIYGHTSFHDFGELDKLSVDAFLKMSLPFKSD